ncbi:unnamed protein product [Ranitomeya imitator]|uniref:GOLD domain-containing protein n=1 Tax=Ranitomeya imitator TaxID=111125 RepID=A0ABN9L8I5_9NEOB|nr:unnamed protein product [Ranitomeya imitator]
MMSSDLSTLSLRKLEEKKEDMADRHSGILKSRERVHLDVQVGEHPLDYASVDPKDKVKEVSYSLEHLRGEVDHITKDQEYQRNREEYYRRKSEDMNGNVLWWAIAQIVILTTVGIWQIKHLKDFLIAKKVV